MINVIQITLNYLKIKTMKKPIFAEYQRNSMYSIELEIATLKLKREFEKTNLYKFIQRLVELLSILIKNKWN